MTIVDIWIDFLNFYFILLLGDGGKVKSIFYSQLQLDAHY